MFSVHNQCTNALRWLKKYSHTTENIHMNVRYFAKNACFVRENCETSKEVHLISNYQFDTNNLRLHKYEVWPNRIACKKKKFRLNASVLKMTFLLLNYQCTSCTYCYHMILKNVLNSTNSTMQGKKVWNHAEEIKSKSVI